MEKLAILLILLATSGCTTIKVSRAEFYTCRQVTIAARMDIASRKTETIQVCKPLSEEQANKFYQEMR